MVKLKLCIDSENDACYPCIMLRKFFNMVFISQDGRKLDVYNATVFGGFKSIPPSQEDAYNSPVQYDKSSTCSLKFKYFVSSDGDDNNSIVQSISSTDLTEAFCAQPDWIAKVWEEFGVVTKQSDIKSTLIEYYPQMDKNTKTLDVAAHKCYIIGSPRDKKYKAVATPGIVDIEGDHYSIRNKGEDAECMEGIELINWVKTSITLKQSILGKRTSFTLELGSEKETLFYTPDFTWYFAPPPGYIMNEDSAKVLFGKDKDEMRNLVQSVADDTTVLFREWKKEQIRARKKARVNLTNFTEALSSYGIMEVKAEIFNPRKGENRQFFMGLVAAFFLSYCSDKTRMNDYYACIKDACTCGENICTCGQWCNIINFIMPFMVILTFICILFKPSKYLQDITQKWKLRLIKFVRWVNVVSTIAVIMHVCFLYTTFFTCYNSLGITCTINWSFTWALTAVSLLTGLAILLYSCWWRKLKIIDFL